MRYRDEKILNYIVNNQGASMEDLLNLFQIARRTLYYSIKNINEEIYPAGEVKRIDGEFIFVGDLTKLKSKLDSSSQQEFFLGLSNSEIIHFKENLVGGRAHY